MRVLYDGHIYRSQKTGGVNRYFANLIGGLPDNVQPILLSDCVREHNFPTHPRLRLIQGKQQRPGYLARRLLALYFRLAARAIPFEVAHPTYYSLLTRLPLSAYRRPVVITIYDMIHELFPNEMDPTGIAAHEKQRAVAQAQAVLCISENTRRDLLRFYPTAEEKAQVIPLAADLAQSMSYGSEPVPDRPYFLFVGQRDGYKNFAALRTAFARIAATRPEAMLCVVGPPFSAAEEEALTQARIRDRVEHCGSVTDAHLAKLYRCSTAFVYPSLYEGFGLPILEAMACGAAVVANDRASIPEVAGEAALLCDTAQGDDLTDALRLVFDNTSTRTELAAKGLRRAAQFSWKETAARTADVYRAISR